MFDLRYETKRAVLGTKGKTKDDEIYGSPDVVRTYWTTINREKKERLAKIQNRPCLKCDKPFHPGLEGYRTCRQCRHENSQCLWGR